MKAYNVIRKLVAVCSLAILYNASFSQGNTFTGSLAGSSVTTGAYLTIYGCEAGRYTTTATGNSFFGFRAGNVTNGGNNCFFGHESGLLNTSGGGNTFYGFASGRNNTTSVHNTVIGNEAGQTNAIGSYNTLLGAKAGYSNVTNNNVMVGYQAGYNNSTGTNNTFLGSEAGLNSTTGHSNVLLGWRTGYNNTTGGNNEMIGVGAGYKNTSGNFNVMVGDNAGYDNTTGSRNVFIGNISGRGSATGSDNVIIGNFAGGDYAYKADTAVFILNNQYKTSNPLLFGRFAGNTDHNTIAGTVTYQAKLGINTNKLEPGMTLTLNGRAYIGNFEPGGINSGLIVDSNLAKYYLWVEKGVVSENYAIASVTEWADYAFNKDYKLMSLKQVAQYIQQNKHLPGMPSEEELKKNGYSVHDMNKNFMLKIEELTLHAIEQNKQIETQQQQIKVLQDALDKYKSLEEEIRQLKAALNK
ncbi:MAG: hypothetical protein QM731_21950 [Chitinophagaceae bacterium]